MMRFIRTVSILCAKRALIILLLFPCLRLAAQKKEPIEILNSDIYRFKKIGGASVKIFAGHVRIKQGRDMYFSCDSLLQFDKPISYMDLFGSVAVTYKKNTVIKADYMRYYPNEGKANLYRNVSVSKEGSTLSTQEAFFNKEGEIFVYNKPGVLQKKGSKLYSNEGIYYGETGDGVFYKKVKLVDSATTLTSDSLRYYGQSGRLVLIAPSVIKRAGQTILASDGYLSSRSAEDSGAESYILHKRPIIFDSAFYTTANDVFVNKSKDITILKGNAIIIDSVNETEVRADSIAISDIKKEFKAMGNSIVYRYQNGRVINIIRSDTLYSNRYIMDSAAAVKYINNPNTIALRKCIEEDKAALRKPIDTSLRNPSISKGRLSIDTNSFAKSAAPIAKDGGDAKDSLYTHRDRYLVAYRNVRIYSDSFQATCDSLYYSSIDSTVRMMKTPIAWANDYQISGSVIYAHINDREVDRIYIPENSFVASQEFDSLYNQARAKEMIYYINKNARDSILLRTNVNMAYFVTDSMHAYVSFDRSAADNAVIHLSEKNKMTSVKFLSNYKATHYPPNKIPRDKVYLNDFVNYNHLRPRSIRYVETYADTIKRMDSLASIRKLKPKEEKQNRVQQDSSFISTLKKYQVVTPKKKNN